MINQYYIIYLQYQIVETKILTFYKKLALFLLNLKLFLDLKLKYLKHIKLTVNYTILYNLILNLFKILIEYEEKYNNFLYVKCHLNFILLYRKIN